MGCMAIVNWKKFTSWQTVDKRLLFSILNMPLLIFGIVLVILGSGSMRPGDFNWEWQDHMGLLYGNHTVKWAEMVGTPLQAPRYFFLSVGSLFCFLFVAVALSTIICHSHSRINSCLYIWYSILLAIVFIAEIGFVFAVAALLRKGVGLMERTVVNGYIKGDTSYAIVNLAWDSAQLFLQCCGYHGGADYKLNKSFYNPNNTLTLETSGHVVIPPSCCTPLTLDAVHRHKLDSTVALSKCVNDGATGYSNYDQGCADKLLPHAVTVYVLVILISLYLIPLVIGASILAVNRRKLQLRAVDTGVAISAPGEKIDEQLLN